MQVRIVLVSFAEELESVGVASRGMVATSGCVICKMQVGSVLVRCFEGGGVGCEFDPGHAG